MVLQILITGITDYLLLGRDLWIGKIKLDIFLKIFRYSIDSFECMLTNFSKIFRKFQNFFDWGNLGDINPRIVENTLEEFQSELQ